MVPSIRFLVVGQISRAAYFVTANWPQEVTRPVFDTQRTPMTLTFELTQQTVRALQETLAKAMLIDGDVAMSARAFKMLLATELAGRVIPEGGSAASGSDVRAG
jgi:hypothetical protein